MLRRVGRADREALALRDPLVELAIQLGSALCHQAEVSVERLVLDVALQLSVLCRHVVVISHRTAREPLGE